MSDRRRRNNINAIERTIRARTLPNLENHEPNRNLAASNIHQIEGLIREIRLLTSMNDDDDYDTIQYLLDELRNLR